MQELYRIHPFKLALLDFEISGEYRIEDLNDNEFVNWSNSILYIGEENLQKISNENLKHIKVIDQ
jgi:hypothetical protein